MTPTSMYCGFRRVARFGSLRPLKACTACSISRTYLEYIVALLHAFSSSLSCPQGMLESSTLRQSQGTVM